MEFAQPLSLQLAAQQQGRDFTISKLAGRGDFFSLSGSGTLAGGAIQANADLNRLAAQLGQFIDLGQTRLAGSLNTEIRWSETASSGWTADADAHVQNFELSAAGLAPWKEPDLQLAAQVRGAIGSAGLDRIDAAKLSVVAGGDQLAAELTEPVQVAVRVHGVAAAVQPEGRPGDLDAANSAARSAGRVAAGGGNRRGRRGQILAAVGRIVADGHLDPAAGAARWRACRFASSESKSIRRARGTSSGPR